MREYIAKDVVLSEINDNAPFTGTDREEYILASVIEIVRNTPAADVEPVEHGKWWNEYDDYSVAKCSNCGATFKAMDADKHNSKKTWWEVFKRNYSHCSNCGALMDENEADEYEEMYVIPNREPPTYTPEEKAKIKAWCEEAGIDPNMIRGMKDE